MTETVSRSAALGAGPDDATGLPRGRATIALIIAGAAWAVFIAILDRYNATGVICQQGADSAQSACEQVQSSVYGSYLGLPLTFWGLVSYLVCGVLWVRGAARMLAGFAMFLLGAELYLVYVQLAVLGLVCWMCMVQFGFVGAVAVAAGLQVVNLPGGAVAKPESMPKLGIAVAGLLLAGAVAISLPELIRMPAPVLKSGAGMEQSGPKVITSTGLPPGVIIIAQPETLPEQASIDPGFDTVLTDGTGGATLEIFSDYECSHCKHNEPTVEKIKEADPSARIVFRDYLIRGHQYSGAAASYADFTALKSGREEYLKVRSELFAAQEKIADYLRPRLENISITPDEKNRLEKKLARDAALARAYGIAGTPATVISNPAKYPGRLIVISGAQPAEVILPFLNIQQESTDK